MTASLFREEALWRFRRSPFQPPLLSKPVSGLLLAALSALAVVGMVLFAFSFQFARKEQATGYLSPVGGWSRVSVRRPAVVRQRFVEAGDVVEAGDELFELTTGEGFEKGQSVANRILRDIGGRREALQARLAATDAQYANDAVLLDAERTAAEREAEHLASELRSHEARHAIATRQYARALRLRRSGAIAEADLLAVADGVESRSVAVTAVLRELATVRTRLETHTERVRRLGHERDAARASASEQLHALSVEEILITHFRANALPIDQSAALAPQLVTFIASGYAFKVIVALVDTGPIYALVGFLQPFLGIEKGEEIGPGGEPMQVRT